MAFFKTRCTQQDTGYALSYGKGSKKLAATIWMNDLGNEWCISSGDGKHIKPQKKLKDIKAAWGAWAEKNYENPQPATPAKPMPPASSGPPAFKRKGPPSFTPPSFKAPAPTLPPPPAKRKAPSMVIESTPEEAAAAAAGLDPTDAQLHDEDGKPNALGALVGVYNWMKANRHRVVVDPSKQDQALNHPWFGVLRVLRRALPEHTFEDIK